MNYVDSVRKLLLCRSAIFPSSPKSVKEHEIALILVLTLKLIIKGQKPRQTAFFGLVRIWLIKQYFRISWEVCPMYQKSVVYYVIPWWIKASKSHCSPWLGEGKLPQLSGKRGQLQITYSYWALLAQRLATKYIGNEIFNTCTSMNLTHIGKANIFK